MLLRKTIKTVSLVAALAISLQIFAGCGKKVEPQNTTTATQSPSAKQEGWKVSDKVVELKVFMVDKPELPISNDTEIIKELTAKTNVKFNFDLAPSSSHKEKFNLMVAANEIPDIVVYTAENILRYADKGAFEPLNDLVDKYGPNVKKAYTSDPSYLKQMTSPDGKYYFIPQLAASKVSEIFIMRKDWLDKLGLKEPNTLDDWYNVLKAFKEKDPNGNGKKDEIPFTNFDRRKQLQPFMSSWGIVEEMMVENGKVLFGSTDPRMKEALIWMNKLYKEGLIDPEYILNDQKQWTAKLTNETSGSFNYWTSRIDFFNDAIKKINPNVNFQAVLPPKGPTGIQTTTRQQIKLREGNSMAIGANSKYKTEIIKFYNYVYSDEGNMLMNFGVEGKHYKMENGTPVYNDIIMKSPDGKAPMIALNRLGMNRDWPMMQDPRYEFAIFSDEVKKAKKLYEPIITDQFPKVKFNQTENDLINSKFVEIQTYRDEMLDRFIMGDEPISKFDDFVAKIKTMGMADVIKAHEEALKRYNGK